MTWLGISIALSVVLTIVLNVALRLFPDAGRRMARGVTRSFPTDDETRPGDRRVHVWTPWKAMILASVMLTIVLNVVLWIA